MKDKIYQRLNGEQSLRDNIDKFIEAFVEYYGEEQREYIEKRFKSAILQGYVTKTGYKNLLNELELSESRKIYEKLMENSSFEKYKEKLFKTEEGKYNSFEKSKENPIDKYERFRQECNLGENKRKENFYEKNYKRITEVFKYMTKDEYMELAKSRKIPKLYSKANDFIKDYMLGFSDYKQEEEKYNVKKEKAVELLKSLNIDVEIENIEEKINTFEELNNFINLYDKAKEKYLSFKKENKNYYENYDKRNKNEKEIKEKYYKQYLKEIYEFIPKKAKEEVKQYIENNKEIQNQNFKNLYDTTIENKPNIVYFSKEYIEKFNNQDLPEYKIDLIKENRIKYLNLMGIDLGENYENYSNYLDSLPSKENVEKILNIYEKNKQKFAKEFYNNLEEEKKIREESQNKGFLFELETEAPERYLEGAMQGGTYVVPNIIKRDKKYEMTGKVIINFDRVDNETTDHMIVHELNHLYELSLDKVENNNAKMISGWDKINKNLNEDKEETIEYKKDNRKYELFNEIINEKIAKDISKIMVDKDIEIFGKANESSYKNTTSYDNTSYLVDDFFNKYKKEIIASRKDNNIDLIFEAVGKDNFENLNELFAEHMKSFPGFEYTNLINDIVNKRETERIGKLKNILGKRNIIYENMNNHYKKYIKENTKKEEKKINKEKIHSEILKNNIKNKEIKEIKEIILKEKEVEEKEVEEKEIE